MSNRTPAEPMGEGRREMTPSPRDTAGAEGVAWPEPPDDYDYLDDAPDEDEYGPGEDCGRWANGRLTDSCSLAGTEFCDWDCPEDHR